MLAHLYPIKFYVYVCKGVLDNESGINVDCWIWLVYSDTIL